MTPEEVVRAELAAWDHLDVDEIMSYFAPRCSVGQRPDRTDVGLRRDPQGSRTLGPSVDLL